MLKDLKRLTKNNPKGNIDRLMNYAYAKDNKVTLAYAGGKYDVDLCEYVSKLAKAKGYDYAPEFIMEDSLIDDYDEDFAILYYLAVQAAELREHLKILEDGLVNGTLVELPCKLGDEIYEICERRIFGKWKKVIVKRVIYSFQIGLGGYIYANCGTTIIVPMSYLGKTAFLTRKEAEQALKKEKKE